MPIDQSTDPDSTTTRRAFLARSVVGGALVTAGAFGTYAVVTSGAAGAETIPSDATLTQEVFAALAAPLELAAVQAYQAAIDTELLDDAKVDVARTFQSHHQAVADALTAMLTSDALAPVANEDLLKAFTDEVKGAADADALFLVLADIEDQLSATHLTAIGILQDPSTAKTVSQVAAVEGQQAAYLTVAGGGSIEDATPAKAPTEGGYSLQKAANAVPTTTTTTTTD
ncbi:MAG: ferritin-like domain-containing protein [Acidimicrobiales bacterium]